MAFPMARLQGHQQHFPLAHNQESYYDFRVIYIFLSFTQHKKNGSLGIHNKNAI